MELKSLKNTEEDMGSIEGDEQEYPYGTRLHLNSSQITLLGIDKCAVGEDVTVYAKAKVTSRSEHESENEGHKTMELQITDMQVVKGTSDKSKALYDNED